MEELQDKLKQLTEERDALINENKALKDKLAAPQTNAEERTKFSNRVTVKSIRAREDEGVGLIGNSVVVSGWVKTRRIQGGGKFAFVELNDGSTFYNLQLIIDSKIEGFEDLKTVGGTGASLWARGDVVASKGKGQKIEIVVRELEILGPCDAGKYPLARGHHPLEFLRSIAHLRPRTNTFGAMQRVRNALAFATHKFYQERGFLYLHTPLITASDCEGAGEMFQVTTLLLNAKKASEVAATEGGEIDYNQDFFGKPAYLTVSGQLNGEIYASALSSIYTFGPTFRAEDSHTSRHLAEFWMIEPEIAFADLHDNMDVAEAYLKYCLAYALETCLPDLQFFDKMSKEKGGLINRIKKVIETPFERITYTKAVELLLASKKKFNNKVSWGIDLNSEHERYLTENIFRKPVIVTDYPKDIKSFYMRQNDDGKTCAAMDVLVPKIGEIIGGSQREERYDVLMARIAELKLNPEDYSWYLELRKYGSVPHSGFGLGFERLVLYTTGLENIRDAIPFPRYPRHAEF
eukprot:TRINITY_DN548_c0_g1_i1.p1 TRINITY_DN548_c0_g1~~TRINITY_DN548_c0_g1_i1.p1  ORF type:complete len:520 (+),score=108.22 TRINITY_DN548_c0_g1_i1:58-1617(+)